MTDLYSKYRHATMITEAVFNTNIELIREAAERSPEAMVECGTWKGGMSAAMIETGGDDRDYLFFDSFAGLPAVEPIDGEAAYAWQADKDSPTYYDNCTAALSEFLTTLSLTGIDTKRVRVRPGFFKDTLAKFTPPAVAVLRIDVDWYAPTSQVFQKFWPSVVPGGLVILDDYGVWEGCTKAVHTFLSTTLSPCPIRYRGDVAYLIKD